MQPPDGPVHILHQEGIVQILQTRAEEGTRLLKGLDAAAHQQLRQNPVDTELRRQLADLLRVGRLLE